MNTPLNGRVAIIDDNFQQALPLINVLSKKRCPSVYFSGDVKDLPDEKTVQNDIRVLFLDINLIDDSARNPKELRAKLVPVLTRIISEDNYPYVLVYWSRNEKEHASLVTDIFDKDLPKRKPIAYISQNKDLYFTLDGKKTAEYEQNIQSLFEKIEKQLGDHQAYRYLIDWENQVHLSADRTLQGIFSATHNQASWSDNAAYIINKLGQAYSGKEAYKKQNATQKVISSFQAFNNVFYDTLEYSVANHPFAGAAELTFDKSKAVIENVYTVNKKLLISDEKGPAEYSGAVLESTGTGAIEKVFNEVLNSCFNRQVIFSEISSNYAPDKVKEMKEEAEKIASSIRGEIRTTWKKVFLVVTPLCDYVQGKRYNNRVVKGMLIKSDFVKYIDDKSEALFLSPKFKVGEHTYVLVLNFRYFLTVHEGGFGDSSPIFRVRQQLLSEIQSKLARHISRQGVLFLDDY